MHKKPHELHTLAEPQQALGLYLDALLDETTFTVEENKQELYVTENAALEKALERATALPLESVSKSKSESESVDVEPVPLADTSQKQTCIATPDWAQNRFQCLSFQVAGVTLAAPLEKLNGIVELTEEITELPGYAPWVIGLLPNRGQNVQVVDVAKIIMPSENDLVVKSTVERMKFIILLDGGKFGLAADSISQVLSLEADDVRWRSTQSKRPWLAGTVIEKMCALLEMDLLCTQLRAGLTGR
ncbi:MAG: chemotaxis protein CheW [Gammaproteobacteria bacterium]|nr:chemotaxis protein CheW [Gammaproteobacteria bacterium]MCF6261679.1 chemotaxis protein CheW [Gammaproteobacteria bacterium]